MLLAFPLDTLSLHDALPIYFIERIDQELRTLNSDYEAKRYACLLYTSMRLQR